MLQQMYEKKFEIEVKKFEDPIYFQDYFNILLI